MKTRLTAADPIEIDQDAIAQLTADHRRVAKLFAEFQNLGDSGGDEAKSTLVAQICVELTVHTQLEEELFYPAVRGAIGDEDLMDEALVEHAGAKALIAQLQAAHPDDDLYDAKVTVLGEQIDHHVTEEEGSMFPQARAAGVDTDALGVELLRRRAELQGRLASHDASPGDEPVSIKPARAHADGAAHATRSGHAKSPTRAKSATRVNDKKPVKSATGPAPRSRGTSAKKKR